MNICVIGTGYVGLVVGTCFAEMGNEVICVDNNIEKLKQLQQGIIPIFEPGLEEMIKSNTKENRLIFTQDIKNAIQKSSICFIAVGTPQKEDGCANIENVEEVAKIIGKYINKYTVIVNKSTVPVGTAEKLSNLIKKETSFEFDIVSNPEFLKQGAAVNDFLKPDRVIVGSNSKKATKIMQELYSPFVKMGNPLILMDVKSAEMTKYASNSFLAMKISFANEIANICEAIGADVEMVRIGMCADKRIGSQFLYAGLGYGGSCFPKDVKALMKTASENNCDYSILKATNDINENQRIRFVNKILNRFNNNIKNMTFAVWGLTFKPKTNDMREAPSITIINELLKNGAKIQAYDPEGFSQAKLYFKDNIAYSKSSYSALENADCLLLLTQWNEFVRPDFNKIKSLLKQPIIFDGRNQYDIQKMLEIGFEYHCIGRKCNQ